ncbi:hypothetical protein CDES_04740 [Corynebacterium deserti GIMN1.010]|uniref:Esterase n=1 Tax=Corynebacterium deserti GIMN1.010 TaxID=931089 RepID=A0A0M4CD71_9CORY|nr:alpha/beta hydrolase-fold protein [Corynebacterium deserti]ALC05391.1 hypothetical protein CDES_04740 [Corynebacterium deserti GIMN1.010]
MNSWRTISLTDTTALIVIIAVAVITALVIVSGLLSKRLRHRTAVSIVLAAVITVVMWLTIEKWWKPFPDATPWIIYGAGGLAIGALLCAVTLPRKSGKRRSLLMVFALLAALNTAAVGNLIYQPYPTVGSFDAQPTSVEMPYTDFEALSSPPTLDGRNVGALVTVPLAGTTDDSQSGFNARDAYAYIPPAYWTNPSLQLPVIVLMPGNPGEPKQWFDSGEASQIADAYQATHDGVSPIVISVDGTGSFSGNPACVDSGDNNVMTYLSQDVPMLIKQKFRVNPDQHTWTIGGLSYGGTCSLQIITNYPDSYGSFLDFSGQAEPTLGTREQTVNQLFDGDEDAFLAVNPEDLLKQSIADKDGKYSHIQGAFIAGSSDKSAVEALTHLNDLAAQAGMTTTFDEVAGGHSFQVWRVALANTFDWAAGRGGLSS